jgi:hypothetical protein
VVCVSTSASLLQDIETDGPSATVPGIVVGVEPRPAFAQRWRKENNEWIKKYSRWVSIKAMQKDPAVVEYSGG